MLLADTLAMADHVLAPRRFAGERSWPIAIRPHCIIASALGGGLGRESSWLSDQLALAARTFTGDIGSTWPAVPCGFYPPPGQQSGSRQPVVENARVVRGRRGRNGNRADDP